MTVELASLLGLAGLIWAAVMGQAMTLNPAYALTNRQDPPQDVSPAYGRLTRAIRNHLEGLALFGTLVVVAHLAEVSNPFTQGAALLYVGSRTVHLACYAAGVTHVRSFAWAVGHFLGLSVMAYGLLSQALWAT